jgi:hypothetical protein
VQCVPATAMSSRAYSPPTSAFGVMAADGSLPRRPVLGRDPVVQLLLGIRLWAQAHGYARDWSKVELVEVNYDPAMLVHKDGRIDSVFVCSIEGDAITGIRVVRNPDKLVYLARQLSATAESFGSSIRTH